MTELVRPDVRRMAGTAALPRENGELVFDAPWQGRVLGMALAVVQERGLDWDEFRQRLIAAIDADPTRPSLKDASEVLVAGESAGAMGVHNNLDDIAERLQPAKVKGIADSGWMPFGFPPLGPGSFDVRPDAPAAFVQR